MQIDLEFIYWTTISFIDILAFIFNALLIYLALFRTPRILKIYTTLIINLAVTDCLSAVFNCFVQPRMIPAGFSLGYVANGFCKHIARDVCFAGYNVLAHLITHSNYSLFLSFLYRYYILIRPEPSRRQISLVVVIIYIPSFLQLVFYQFAQSDSDLVAERIHEYYPHYNFTGLTLTGVADIRDFFAMFKILQMTIVVVIIFVGILIIRRKIIQRLVFRDFSVSAGTKTLHSQLLMALTYQALIPMIYIISIVMYILQQSGIYTTPAFEDHIISGLILIPLLSPISSFVFFTPYRRFLLSLIGKVDKQKPSASSLSLPDISKTVPLH